MSEYNVILFLHVLAAFGIFAFFALEWTGLNSLQHSCTGNEARESLKKFKVLPWIGGPSFLISLLSGIYLMIEAWQGSAWPVISLISVIVIAVVGAVLTGPRMAALGRSAASSEAEAASLRERYLPFLRASFQVRTWMAVGIAFLMTVKPGAAGSIIAMLISILIGLAMQPISAGVYRRQVLCAVKR